MTAPLILFMPVTCSILGNLEDWECVHASIGRSFADRAEAIAWGVEALGHDDFRIATLVEGRLSAIGWGMDDFDPDEEDLPDIARQMALEVAA